MVNLLKAFKVSPDANGNLPPKETVNTRIIILGLYGLANALLFGYDLGFIGGSITLPGFSKDFGMDHASEDAEAAFHSNVVSAFQAGATVGSLVPVYLSDRFGRRTCLMVNLIIYLIGAALMTGANGAGMVYAGRVLTGWGVGCSTMVVPVYVAECSPPHVRGRLVGLYEVGVQMGTMIGFWVPYGLLRSSSGSAQWRIPFGLQLIPAALCAIGLLFLTETPRYIAQKHGEEKAIGVLSRLRNLPADHWWLKDEISAIMTQLEGERMHGLGTQRFHSFRRLFGSASNRRRLLVGVMVMIWFQMAGTNAVNYFSPRIFATMGLSRESSKLFATGVYGVIRFVATLIAMVLFTDRFGRRTMIIVGGSVMSVCMYIVGGIQAGIPSKAGDGVGSAQIAELVFIYIWAVAFCFSYAGIPWIYCAEIFPLDVRSLGMAICTAVHWAFNLMLAKCTPYIIKNTHGYGIFFLFAACTTVGAIYEYFFMPETRGRSLEEIEAAFDPKKKRERSDSDDFSHASDDDIKDDVAHVDYTTPANKV